MSGRDWRTIDAPSPELLDSDEADFWDWFHDEAFPDNPEMLGAFHAEVERMRSWWDVMWAPYTQLARKGPRR